MEFRIVKGCLDLTDSKIEEKIPSVYEFVDNIVKKYNIDSLEYFVVADSEQDKFGNTVKKYSTLIGSDEYLIDNDVYVTSAKSIDGVDGEGRYKQVVIIKSMVFIAAVYALEKIKSRYQYVVNDA